MSPKETYKEELLDLAAEAFEAAERARLDALKAEGKARRLKRKARALRNLAGLAPRMPTDEGTMGYRVSAGSIDVRWPLRRALAKRKWSIPDMLAKLFITEITAGTVRSWLKPSQPRAVPRKWALYFQEAFRNRDADGNPLVGSEVPAVDASWPGGIQD